MNFHRTHSSKIHLEVDIKFCLLNCSGNQLTAGTVMLHFLGSIDIYETKDSFVNNIPTRDY